MNCKADLCRRYLSLAKRHKYESVAGAGHSSMNLSIITQTDGVKYARRFLHEFRQLAGDLDADLVIAGDGDNGQAMAQDFADRVVRIDLRGIPEAGIRPACEAACGDMILRLDDDETVSPAMRDWLLKREWEQGGIFSFPYAWLWEDDKHFLTSRPFWPDPHTRLMPKDLTARWKVYPHAGNRFGLGKLIPVAHCHHKFLVQSVEQRQQRAAKYESVGPGLGLGMHYGKFFFPERFCTSLTVRELGDGTVKLDEWVDQGEQIDKSTTWRVQYHERL